MFRLYSKGCEYAIRALAHVPAGRPPQRIGAKEICRKAGIPESFTRKVLQALVRGRFLRAVPGRGGGYALTRDPRHVSVRSVIEAVDGKDTFHRCIMGVASCDERKDCPLHPAWSQAKKRLLRELNAATVKDLSRLAERSPRGGSR